MTQSTAAQTQAAQAKADRRAAALERKQTEISSDNNRVKAMYANAQTKTPNPRVIAVAAAPVEVQELVAEIAPLWKEQTGFDFPDVVYCGPADSYGGEENKDTWWVEAGALPAALGPMFTKKGARCVVRKNGQPGEYRYRCAALSTVLNRLKKGLPLFAN